MYDDVVYVMLNIVMDLSGEELSVIKKLSYFFFELQDILVDSVIFVKEFVIRINLCLQLGKVLEFVDLQGVVKYLSNGIWIMV